MILDTAFELREQTCCRLAAALRSVSVFSDSADCLLIFDVTCLHLFVDFSLNSLICYLFFIFVACVKYLLI
jgi:hypothetical protein